MAKKVKERDKFPRSEDLPSQSPLFWVSQKDRYLRQLLIRDIQDVTGRQLVVYFGNRYEQAQIDQRDIALMKELFNNIGGKPVDLLIETAGGVTDATEGLVSLIQAMATDLRVIVPNAAKSNGTVLCLAAKTIVMGVTSELGPIEPSVGGIPSSILSEDAIKNSNFPLHKVGVYALQQTRGLALKLLTDGMMKGSTPEKIEETVDALSSRKKFFSHGSVINHLEAKQLGLAVEYLQPDDELWKKVWLLYCMYDHDCRRDRYLKVFEGPLISTSIAAPR
jgi:ClpP class serine protease